MIAWPAMSGANGFAAASSCGPAALWIMPEMPLPASNEWFADSAIRSASISKIEARLIVNVIMDYRGLYQNA